MIRKRSDRATAETAARHDRGRRVREASGLKAPSPLRGLLPVPREVNKLVARETAERPMSDAARRRLTAGFTLQYFFGGHDLVYRETDQGPEVLAVGDEIGPLLRRLKSADRQTVILTHPHPW